MPNNSFISQHVICFSFSSHFHNFNRATRDSLTYSLALSLAQHKNHRHCAHHTHRSIISDEQKSSQSAFRIESFNIKLVDVLQARSVSSREVTFFWDIAHTFMCLIETTSEKRKEYIIVD